MSQNINESKNKNENDLVAEDKVETSKENQQPESSIDTDIVDELQDETNKESDIKKPLTPQQMMNRFVPFKDMPVGTVFELSGLRMRKMEYARRPDTDEGYFNALQLGIEDGYMWVKEDNLFKVVPANPRKNNNRRRRKSSRGRNRNSSNTNNNRNSNRRSSSNNRNNSQSQKKKN